MAGQDATAGLPPIGVDPTQWYQMQRKQMMVQALTQQALTPIQENNFPGQRIRSRIGPLQPAAQILAAYLADSKGKSLAADQSNMYQQSMVPFGGAPPADPSQQQDQGGTFQNPSPPPAAQASSPGAGAGGGAPSPAPSGAAPGVGPAPTGGGSLNPMGLPPALAMRMFAHDPSKYGELVAGPEGWRTAMMATGGDTAAAQRLIVAKMVKEGTLDVRPGGMLLGKNPDGTTFQLRNPTLPSGVEPDFGPGGTVTGAHLIPGVAQAESVIAGAGEYGKEQGKLQEIPTGSGHTRPQIGVQGVAGAGAPGQLPPGLTGAPAAPGGPPAGPQYFPPRAPLPGAGAAPGGGGQGDTSWWPKMPKIPEDNSLGEPSTFQHTVNETRGKIYADHVKQLGLEADTADQKLEYSTELLRNLPQAFTGPQASGTASFWNAVSQVPGVKALLPKEYTQDAAGTNIVIKNLVNQAIQGARAIYGPRMAQSEVMLQKNEASPSITMGIQAIYALQRQEDAKSAYFIQRKNDFDKYSEQGGDPIRFEGAYQTKFPLAKFASAYAERNAPLYQPPKQIASPAAVQMLLKNPDLRGHFVEKYGYLPPEMRQ